MYVKINIAFIYITIFIVKISPVRRRCNIKWQNVVFVVRKQSLALKIPFHIKGPIERSSLMSGKLKS